MFETLLRLWQEGRLNTEGLERAVSKGWISEEQRYEIETSIMEADNNEN